MAARGAPPAAPAAPSVRIAWDEVVRATEDFAPANQLGDGAFGPVYRGALYCTPVAVKRLRLSPTARYGHSTLQTEREFLQEASLLRALRHPNIVTLIGGASGPQGERALVYELLDGGTVDDQLFPRSAGGRPGGARPLGWRSRVSILRQVARALLYLHSLRPPLCHLDVKGANVLLDGARNACLADFGLARQQGAPRSGSGSDSGSGAAAAEGAAAAPPSHVQTRHLSGTYGYICPEYATTGRFGTACDTYGWGVVALQMLTARPAMSGDTPLVTQVEEAFRRERSALAMADASARWPKEAYLEVARIAKKCVKPTRAQRPGLHAVIERLERLEAAAEAAAEADAKRALLSNPKAPPHAAAAAAVGGGGERPARAGRQQVAAARRAGERLSHTLPARLPTPRARPPWALDDDEDEEAAAAAGEAARAPARAPGAAAAAVPLSEASLRAAPLRR